jgi:hypothetical protein
LYSWGKKNEVADLLACEYGLYKGKKSMHMGVLGKVLKHSHLGA